MTTTSPAIGRCCAGVRRLEARAERLVDYGQRGVNLRRGHRQRGSDPPDAAQTGEIHDAHAHSLFQATAGDGAAQIGMRSARLAIFDDLRPQKQPAPADIAHHLTPPLDLLHAGPEIRSQALGLRGQAPAGEHLQHGQAGGSSDASSRHSSTTGADSIQLNRCMTWRLLRWIAATTAGWLWPCVAHICPEVKSSMARPLSSYT